MRVESSNFGAGGKAAQVRSMFSEIAPRYDFLNHVLSLNIDRRWRRFMISKIAHHLVKSEAVALDLCCGTGDLSLELAHHAATVGVDFCHPMLKLGAKKVGAAAHPVELVEGDALSVPFCDSLFDVVTIAFGLRNLEDIEAGLVEIRRLIRPGGCGAVLEFSHPRIPVFRNLFEFYFSRVLPRIGNAVSGSSFAYQYLPASVQAFPDQEELAALMRSVGFLDVKKNNLFGGVASLHVGGKER
jgi:demethylmenaquinone methyltransferase/2-methoxy-6-polyprenyl-1,4-benzoquinol methylase